jgi:hypothetical protein
MRTSAYEGILQGADQREQSWCGTEDLPNLYEDLRAQSTDALNDVLAKLPDTPETAVQRGHIVICLKTRKESQENREYVRGPHPEELAWYSTIFALIAFPPPFALLLIAGIARWVYRGFRRSS